MLQNTEHQPYINEKAARPKSSGCFSHFSFVSNSKLLSRISSSCISSSSVSSSCIYLSCVRISRSCILSCFVTT